MSIKDTCDGVTGAHDFQFNEDGRFNSNVMRIITVMSDEHR